MNKEFINPSELPDWSSTFSQVVTVSNTTKTVYVAGQVGVDRQQRIAGDGCLAAQTEQAFKNLVTALTAAEAAPADVVRLKLYVKNYQPVDARLISEIYRKYFPHSQLPASTWLGVQSLAREEFLIEIDAVAIIE